MKILRIELAGELDNLLLRYRKGLGLKSLADLEIVKPACPCLHEAQMISGGRQRNEKVAALDRSPITDHLSRRLKRAVSSVVERLVYTQ